MITHRALSLGLLCLCIAAASLGVLASCRTAAKRPIEVTQDAAKRTASRILADLWPTNHNTFELLRCEDGPKPGNWGLCYGTGDIHSTVVIFIPKHGGRPFITCLGSPPISRMGWFPEIETDAYNTAQ
jgi:hypothetical protein